ncbi:epididymal sperm-binding protein 1-like [Sceloporus undulatus]|uniref:epididymal sperm-binding protein 1-like n=1 Tax=Sceloporus undulatus TaxID=8520 RepID=UPI001C4CBF88|nr:epididymal sperm-binding protein 1-like [Sceloporus undulatus]XP_042331318.1 epididymal sperm-binding protein 1-like [Sceloporus undulatus]
MAFPVAVLLYTWVFLPLAASEVFPPCVFPFIFEGTSYSKCTTNGTKDNQPWCAITSNYDKDHQWKPCTITDYGGNSGGHPCVFPFIYLRHTYYTCINKLSQGRFWCSTTGNYDKNRKWSYCADTRLGENYPTRACVFPFTYENKLYSSCTTAGRSDGRLWCSVFKNYDMNPSGAFCEPSEQAPCNFPFIYKNKSYSSCTKEGSFDGQLWCATTPNYDKHSRWKACATEEYGGNSNGAPCFFPFIFKNQSYENCTNEGEKSGRYWCATTRHYDVDLKFSYCADTKLGILEPLEEGRLLTQPPLAVPGNNTDSKEQCVFPFIYKGKSYSTCTKDGLFSWKLWCSLTANYDTNRMWKYCNPSDLQNQNSTQPY